MKKEVISPSVSGAHLFQFLSLSLNQHCTSSTLLEMMVLRHGGGGGSGGFLASKQVVPLSHDAEVSHRLLQSSLCNDLRSAHQCLADPFVDVNYVGAVCLKMRKTGVVLTEESPSLVRVCYEEFRTDAMPLFVAVTNGNSALVRQLLVNSLLHLHFCFLKHCSYYGNPPFILEFGKF